MEALAPAVEAFQVAAARKLDGMWSDPQLFACWCAVVFAAQELVIHKGVLAAFSPWRRIRPRGRHLDALEPRDRAFINFNRAVTCVFTYQLAGTLWRTPTVAWALEDATLANTLGSFVCFFVVYDLFYCLFHRFLHLRSVYRFVHKHHHRQMAPSRGNVDAINVHPFEFAVGEYLHLFCAWAVPCHALAVLAFVLTGGVLASLNHTRYDVRLPLGLFRVEWHDVHHRMPQSNYSQYTVLWDRVFSSYLPWTDKVDKDA